MQMKSGDFVDATLVADIISHPGSKRATVRFSMKDIVRLQGAKRVAVSVDGTATAAKLTTQQASSDAAMNVERVEKVKVITANTIVMDT